MKILFGKLIVLMNDKDPIYILRWKEKERKAKKRKEVISDAVNKPKVRAWSLLDNESKHALCTLSQTVSAWALIQPKEIQNSMAFPKEHNINNDVVVTYWLDHSAGCRMGKAPVRVYLSWEWDGIWA